MHVLTSHLLMQSSDVAFTIVVNRQDDDTGQGEDEAEDGDRDKDDNRVEVDFVQEAVQEAIQEAVQDAMQEVCWPIHCSALPLHIPHPKQLIAQWVCMHYNTLQTASVKHCICARNLLLGLWFCAVQ